MIEADIAAMRQNYTQHGLRREELDPDPLAQFRIWFAAVLGVQSEANAMTLATASASGEPSARIVLMKGCDERGLTFFTNYGSAKAADLIANPRAALVFYWDKLERQVRLTGAVEKTTREETMAYFQSRPHGSQLGAWASAQSGIVANRAELEASLKASAERFAGEAVSLPEHWGGFRLIPATWEFWQGRQNRLHDRFRYTHAEAGSWRIERLAP